MVRNQGGPVRTSRSQESLQFCDRCGQEYQLRSGTQQFCLSCAPRERLDYQREYNRHYYESHKERIMAKAKAKRLENRLLGGPGRHYRPKECDRCHKQYEPSSANQKHCPDCRPLVRREWDRVHNSEYRRKYPERVKESAKRWKEEHRELFSMKQHVYYARYVNRMRRKLVGHYSNGTFRCACCGESQFDFLCIDHVNNNGAEERRALFGRNSTRGYAFYIWLIKNGFPSGYAILCMNCNFSKGKHGVCAHTKYQTGASDAQLAPQWFTGER